jgi:hypothetical protein
VSRADADQRAEAWAAEARRLRHEGEYLCSRAGERFDEANEADAVADYWRAQADADGEAS